MGIYFEGRQLDDGGWVLAVRRFSSDTRRTTEPVREFASLTGRELCMRICQVVGLTKLRGRIAAIDEADVIEEE